VQLFKVPLVGVPNNGVTKVGEVAKTNFPVPVSSYITPSNSAEVVASMFVEFKAPILILAEPSKEVPPIVLVVARIVAVAALPVQLAEDPVVF